MNVIANQLDYDIFDDVNDDVLTEEEYNAYDKIWSVDEWFSYHQKYYKSTLSLSIYYRDDILDIINILSRRLNYLLNAYDIEHSEIFLKDTTLSLSSNNMRMYDFGKYKLISAFFNDSIDRELPYSYNALMLKIVVYVNYPKFTYKQAYRFTRSLMHITWENLSFKSQSQPITAIWLNDKVLTYDGFYFESVPMSKTNNSHHCIKLIRDYMLFTLNTFKSDKYNYFVFYFDSIMSYFFNRDKTSTDMIYKVKRGINPFNDVCGSEIEKR